MCLIIKYSYPSMCIFFLDVHKGSTQWNGETGWEKRRGSSHRGKNWEASKTCYVVWRCIIYRQAIIGGFPTWCSDGVEAESGVWDLMINLGGREY